MSKEKDSKTNKKFKVVIEKEFARNRVENYQSRWFHTRIIREIKFDTIEELERKSLDLYKLAARLVQFDIKAFEQGIDDEIKTTVKKKMTKKTRVMKGGYNEE